MFGLFLTAGLLLVAAASLVAVIDGPAWLAAGALSMAATILLPMLLRTVVRGPGERVPRSGRARGP